MRLFDLLLLFSSSAMVASAKEETTQIELAQSKFTCDVRGRISNKDFHKDVNEILAVFGLITPVTWQQLPSWYADHQSAQSNSYRQDLFRYLVYMDETNRFML